MSGFEGLAVTDDQMRLLERVDAYRSGNAAGALSLTDGEMEWLEDWEHRTASLSRAGAPKTETIPVQPSSGEAPGQDATPSDSAERGNFMVRPGYGNDTMERLSVLFRGGPVDMFAPNVNARLEEAIQGSRDPEAMRRKVAVASFIAMTREADIADVWGNLNAYSRAYLGAGADHIGYEGKWGALRPREAWKGAYDEMSRLVEGKSARLDTSTDFLVKLDSSLAGMGNSAFNLLAFLGRAFAMYEGANAQYPVPYGTGRTDPAEAGRLVQDAIRRSPAAVWLKNRISEDAELANGDPATLREGLRDTLVGVLASAPRIAADMGIMALTGGPAVPAFVAAVDAFYDIQDDVPEMDEGKALLYATGVGAVDFLALGVARGMGGDLTEKGVEAGVKPALRYMGLAAARGGAAGGVSQFARNILDLALGRHGDWHEMTGGELRGRLFSGVPESAMTGAAMAMGFAATEYPAARMRNMAYKYKQAMDDLGFFWAWKMDEAGKVPYQRGLPAGGETAGGGPNPAQPVPGKPGAGLPSALPSGRPAASPAFKDAAIMGMLNQVSAARAVLLGAVQPQGGGGLPAPAPTAPVAAALDEETRFAAADTLAVIEDAADAGAALEAVQTEAVREMVAGSPAEAEAPRPGSEEAEQADVARRAKDAEKRMRLRRKLPHDPAETEAAFAKFAKRYPGVEFVFVRGVDAFPRAALDDLAARGYAGRRVARALVMDGRVYVDTARVRPSEVPEVVMHEVVGHLGFDALFPEEQRNEVLDSVWDEHSEDPLFRRVVERYFPEKADGDGTPRLDSPEDRRRAAREFIARVAQDSAPRPSWWRELLQKIRMWLARVFGRPVRITDRELDTMLARQDRAARGKAVARRGNLGLGLYGSIVETPGGGRIVFLDNKEELHMVNLNDRDSIHDYLEKFIEENPKGFLRLNTDDRIRLGTDLPNEYTRGKYSEMLDRRISRISKVKRKMATDLDEAIAVSGDKTAEKARDKNRENGVYYRRPFTFALPSGHQGDIRVYTANLLSYTIDGDEYLYDVVNIEDAPVEIVSAAEKAIANLPSRIADNGTSLGTQADGAKTKITGNSGLSSGKGENFDFSIGNLWTGTSASYEKPSLHFVGTGEGNQVYGWGLYATDNRGIAEWYADKDAEEKYGQTTLTYQGQTMNYYNLGKVSSSLGLTGLEEQAVRQIFNVGGIDKAIDSLEHEINNYKGDIEYYEGKEQYRVAGSYRRELELSQKKLDFLKEHKEELVYKEGGTEGRRHLYRQTWFTNRVNDGEANLLEWYKEMPKAVLSRIYDALYLEMQDKERWYSGLKEELNELKNDYTEGGDVYSTVEAYLGSPKAASEFLFDKCGIDGVRYPANQGDGSDGWNYVSFSDTNMRVDEHIEWMLGDEAEDAEAKRQYDDVVKRAKGTPIWMKAPNGKTTRLTEGQWVQTRTENFKNYFGDHELAALLDNVQRAWSDSMHQFTFRFAPSERLRNGLSSILGHDVTNVMITDSSVIHTRNHHGANEAQRGQIDITPEDFVTIPYLLNNYDTIRRAKEHDDKIGQRAVEITKRINGVAVVATIEKGKDNEAFVTLWKKASPAPMFQDNLSPALNVQDDGGLLYKVKQDIEKIKSSARNSSKIIDENGEPMVVYHQTGNEFSEFDPRRGGAGTFDNELPFGIFMKPHAQDIGLEGKIQMPLFARIVNPIYFTNRQALSRHLRDNVKGYAELKEAYDAVDKEYQQKLDALEKEWERRIDEWDEARPDSTEAERESADKAISRELGEDALMEEWRGKEEGLSARMKELVDRHFRGSGHDGIILEQDKGAIGKQTTKTVIAFDSNQVKSATGNTGAFSREDPDIDYSLDGYSEAEERDMVDILRGHVGQALTEDDEAFARYLGEHGAGDVAPADAHVFAVKAVRENQRAARARQERARNDWLYNQVPMWRHMVDFAGGGDFVLVPSERFVGQEFTGTFIAPEFVKYSGNDGRRLDGRRKTDFLKRRNKALRSAKGVKSDEAAAAIARKINADPVELEQKLVDFYRDLKKPDLYGKYTDWKRENFLEDRELERQAMEMWRSREEERARDEAVRVLEAGRPVATPEWAAENQDVWRELCRKVLGREAGPRPSKTDMDLVNAAIVQRQADPAALREANRLLRERAFGEYAEKLKALREKVMKDKADVLSLQREALDFAERSLPREERGDFARRIVGLLDLPNTPSGEHPEGRRQEAFGRLWRDILERAGDSRREAALEEIHGMLDAARMRRNYRGVPVSVLPSEQARVDRIRKIVGLDLAAAANIVTANSEEIARLDGEADDPAAAARIADLVEDNALVETFRTLDRRPAEDAEKAAGELRRIVEGGRSGFRAALEARRARLEGMRNEMMTAILGGDRSFQAGSDNKGPFEYWLLNLNLPSLMRMGVPGQGWDKSLPGRLYARIEDATWGEQDALRRLQDDFDAKLLELVPDETPGRGVKWLKDIRRRARLVNELERVEEHSGVHVLVYSRPVGDPKAGIMETGRRRALRVPIPVEDYVRNGKAMPGARSILRIADGDMGPARSWSGPGMPRNYLAPDETEIPVVAIDVRLPDTGGDNLGYAEAAARSFAAAGPVHNDRTGMDIRITGNNAAKMRSAAAASGVSSYAYAVAVKNIPVLLKAAELGASHADRHARAETRQVHRLFSAFVLDGRLHAVKFTVKELANPEGMFLYTLQPEELEVEAQKTPGDAVFPATRGNAGNSGRSPLKAANAIQFKSLFGKFKPMRDFPDAGRTGGRGRPVLDGRELDPVAIEFLRQQLADFDAGLKASYEVFNDQNDDAAFNRILEEERAEGRLVVVRPDPDEVSEDRELALTQGAALQCLLTWEQPQYRAGMMWNGWSEESVRQLKAFLRPEFRKLGEWMRDYIRRSRAALDRRVFERFGAHLPENENYFPGVFLSRGNGRVRDDANAGRATLSINPGFLVARKWHLLPVDLNTNAVRVFLDNQMQQAHFLAWDEVMRDLAGVYGSQAVQGVMNARLGRNVTGAILDRLSVLAMNGRPQGDAAVARALASLYRHWMTSKIALNIGSMLKQWLGQWAYMNEVPAADFMRHMLRGFCFAPEYREFVAAAKETPYFKARQGGAMDRDLISFLNNARNLGNYSPALAMLNGVASAATMVGDRLASLSASAYAVYRHAYENAAKGGASPEEARKAGLRAWQRATDETQQSGYLKDLNRVQSSQTFYRWATAFLSNPIQVMNLEAQSYEAWRRERTPETRDEYLRRVVVNHLIVPAMMMGVSQLLSHGIDFSEWDWEDFVIGAMLGPLEGAFLAGKSAEILGKFSVKKGMGKNALRESVSAVPFLDDLVRDFDAGWHLFDGDITERDVLEGIRTAGDVLMLGGDVAGSPLAGGAGGILSSAGTQAKRLLRIFGPEETRRRKRGRRRR